MDQDDQKNKYLEEISKSLMAPMILGNKKQVLYLFKYL